MPRRPRLAIALLTLTAGCAELDSIEGSSPDTLPATERDRVVLGHDLFFDPGLSGAGDVSCASCHDPELHGADGLPKSIGTLGQTARRNAPSVFNAALSDRQFWDGRASSLEEQAMGPLFSEHEMGQTQQGLVAYVERAYASQLDAAFPDRSGPTVDQITAALAAYQRHLPQPSRFDRFIDGDRQALSRQERRGYRLFERNCSFCHTGAGVGGSQFETLGDQVPWPQDRREDQGLFEVTGNPDDQMRFVVPSLRNVTRTAPYFHDGSVETLDEAVRLMARHQLDRTFTDRQARAIVAFLGTLEIEEIPAWAYADWAG